MIDAKRILQETYPDFKFNKDNKWVINGLKKLIHEDDLNEFLFKNQHLRGFAFLDKLISVITSFNNTMSASSIIPARDCLTIL